MLDEGLGSTRARSVAVTQSMSKKLPARELLGSQGQHRGKAAQNKPESTTAREFIGQHKSQKRTGCPKYEQKTSREGSNWAAKSSTAEELSKASRKTSPRQK